MVKYKNRTVNEKAECTEEPKEVVYVQKIDSRGTA